MPLSESQPRFVWMDLEMTGLNVSTDVILEIAAVVTGPNLEPLVAVERVVHYPDDVLEQMSGRVRRMHTDNGLIEAVRSSQVILAMAERDVLREVAAYCMPGQGILCGSSVHQDRRFLVKYMPRLEQHLHFHQVDIATMNVLVNAWFPDKPNAHEYTRPPTRHRAMADVTASLEELRFYCREAFGIDLRKLT